MQYPIIDNLIYAYQRNGWTGLNLIYGKNLYNETAYPMLPDYIIAGNTGQIGPSSIGGCATSRYIDISNLRGKTITLNHSPGGMVPGFAFYRGSLDDYSFISGISNNNTTQQGDPWTITIPNNPDIAYMRFSSNNTYIGQIQIELGTEATPYEPYAPPTTDIKNRMKLPMIHYFPHPVIDAIISAADGQHTEEEKEILRHYLTPLGIGGI